MLKIRPYNREDAPTILSWCKDEKAFYQWSAGVLGNFPIGEKEFRFVENLMPFVAYNESGVVGFFTLRKPSDTEDELRFGFVIVCPFLRGKGYGKAMLTQGTSLAFEIYGASKVSLGVFDNNLSAYHCYKAAGFEDVILNNPETYSVLGETWKCKELMITKK